MIDIYKLIKSIAVRHKVGSNDDSEMVSQLSPSSPIDTSISIVTVCGGIGLDWIGLDLIYRQIVKFNSIFGTGMF